MGVRSARPERADTGAAWCRIAQRVNGLRPLRGLAWRVKVFAAKVDLRVDRAEVDTRRDLPVSQVEHRPGQPGYSRRAFEVPDVRLDRRDRAPLGRATELGEG